MVDNFGSDILASFVKRLEILANPVEGGLMFKNDLPMGVSVQMKRANPFPLFAVGIQASGDPHFFSKVIMEFKDGMLEGLSASANCVSVSHEVTNGLAASSIYVQDSYPTYFSGTVILENKIEVQDTPNKVKVLVIEHTNRILGSREDSEKVMLRISQQGEAHVERCKVGDGGKEHSHTNVALKKSIAEIEKEIEPLLQSTILLGSIAIYSSTEPIEQNKEDSQDLANGLPYIDVEDIETVYNS